MSAYGIYRDRAKSALLSSIMLDERAACRQANALAGQLGGSWCVVGAERADELPEVLHFGARFGPKVIERWGRP